MSTSGTSLSPLRLTRSVIVVEQLMLQIAVVLSDAIMEFFYVIVFWIFVMIYSYKVVYSRMRLYERGIYDSHILLMKKTWNG